MPANGALGIDIEQHAYEEAQREALRRSTGVGRGTVRQQAAFVGDADTPCIPSPDVRAGAVEGAHREDDTFTDDVEVIAATAGEAAAVFAFEVIGVEAAVAPGSGAVDNKEVDAADAV